MTFMFLTGENFNQLTLGTVTSNTSFQSGFPLINVYDNRPGKPGIAVDSTFVSPGLTIVCDGNHNSNTNGGFESTTSGWSSSITGATLTIASSSGNPQAGSWALAFVATSSGAEGTAYWATNLEVESGSDWRMEAYVANQTACLGVWLENLDSGQYWTGSAWQAGGSGLPINWGYSASSSYNRLVTNIAMQTYGETGKDTVRLRIGARREANGAAAGTGYVDSIAIWPRTNFVSAHSHNFPKLNSTSQGALIVEGSSDNFTTNNRLGTLDSTITNSYLFIATGLSESGYQYRYMRLRAGITLIYGGSTGQVYDEALRFGEVVFGQVRTFSEEPLHEALSAWKIDYSRPQTRGVNLARGTIAAYPYGTDPVRIISIPYRINASTGYDDFVNDMVRRSGQGQHPIVVVPDSERSDVLFCRLPEDQSFDNFHTNAYDTTLTLVEEAGPVWMSS